MSDLSDVGGDIPQNGGERSGKLEDDSLRQSHHDRLAKAVADMEVQRWWFRAIAGAVALIVMAAAGVLEYIFFKHFLSSCTDIDDLLFIWAVAPIASITVMVIFLLIGVFRGFSGKDMERLPSSAAAGMVGMNGS